MIFITADNGMRQLNIFLMFLIDFQGGTHGNFLEFCLNKLAGTTTATNRFNDIGASHYDYEGTHLFVAEHYSFLDSYTPLKTYALPGINLYEGIVRITFTEDDLPILVPNVLHRVGNANIRLDDPDYFKDFFNKANDPNIGAPFREQLKCWSENSSMDVNNPEVDKNSIRELLKFSYRYNNNGLTAKNSNLNYPKNLTIKLFPFSAFYNWHTFKLQLSKVLNWANIDADVETVSEVYDEFLNKNIFKDIQKLPLEYFNYIKSRKHIPITGLNIYQEAYIDYLIEKEYSIEALFYHENGKYYSNTKDIINYLNQTIGKT